MYTHIKWLGIIIAAFGISIVDTVFSFAFGDVLSNEQMLVREFFILSLVALLLWQILPDEGNNFDTIWLHNRHWAKSLLYALITGVLALAAMLGCIELAKMFGWPLFQSDAFSKLSKPVIALITIRAGIAEEVFYRGYLMHHLSRVFRSKWIALFVICILFGALHYSQGAAGILIATGAGLVFGVALLFTKDLKANIIAHFLIDFTANVILN